VKQILFEMWTYNKCSPKILAAKIFLAFTLLTIGLWIPGFPYAIVLWCCCIGTGPLFTLPTPRVEYLIPRDSKLYSREICIKSMISSGFFSISATLGYIMLICVSYRWNIDTILFILVIFSLTFLTMFLFLLSESSGPLLPQAPKEECTTRVNTAKRNSFLIFCNEVFLFYAVLVGLRPIQKISFLREVPWIVSGGAIYIVILILDILIIRQYIRKRICSAPS